MWKSYLTSPTTIVWPALFPPYPSTFSYGCYSCQHEINVIFTWQRAQISASPHRMSESFPLPSSPHWAPRTTVTPLVDRTDMTLVVVEITLNAV